MALRGAPVALGRAGMAFIGGGRRRRLVTLAREQVAPMMAMRAASIPPVFREHRRHLSASAASVSSSGCCGVPNCMHQKKDGDLHHEAQHDHPCWACGRPTGCCAFFCACGKIQPMVNHCDYFETFHLPRQYDLDVKELEKSYWSIQKNIHPDRYGQKSREEQDLSTSNATYLNVAYKTLKEPTLRAKYLLQLQGVNVLDEASKTADPELLMHIMELREHIEDACSVEDLRHLIRENRAQIDQTMKEIASQYATKDWDGMAHSANRLQYLTKVEQEARDRMDRIEDQHLVHRVQNSVGASSS